MEFASYVQQVPAQFEQLRFLREISSMRSMRIFRLIELFMELKIGSPIKIVNKRQG